MLGFVDSVSSRSVKSVTGAMLKPTLQQGDAEKEVVTLRQRFERSGQDHVFRFMDQGLVPEEQRESFLKQLEGLDLGYIERSFHAALSEATAGTANSDLAPPDAFTSLADCSREAVSSWNTMGIEAIGRGEVAACVLAGGQGTRLGFDGPKGCYDIGLPSHKPLFQLMVERIRRLVSLAQAQGFSRPRVPLLVMTSPINDAETRRFFAEQGYFGLSPEDVWFFEQGTLPCLTMEGKIILEAPGLVATAPDGNGGFYPALQRSGTMDKLQAAGCKYLHVFSVDNSLCRPADPCFVGYCIESGADVGNKCVWKANPDEKVGVVAKKGGKPSVVEYSELDEASKNLRDENGRLLFGAGNICNHFYRVDFLVDTVIPNSAGLFHLAHKKIPCADENGITVKPSSNNGIKLEAFIFDVFPMSKNMAVLEAARQEEFAPVKNAPGDATDSPITARQMVSDLCKSWVRAAGGQLEGNEDALLEISPLVSYAGEELSSVVTEKAISLPLYMSESKRLL